MSARTRPVSLAALVERHRPDIMAYLTRLLGDVHDAQDACQETFLRAHRAFTRLPAGSNARAWLYRIATNTGLTVARQRARRRTVAHDVDVDALPGPAAASPEHREAVRAVGSAVRALPPRQRAALMLRVFQGLAYVEIAASLGGNEATARANVYQAIKKLRAAVRGTT
jgi:RNA polymerase sigma factor (sigma-70 family)